MRHKREKSRENGHRDFSWSLIEFILVKWLLFEMLIDAVQNQELRAQEEGSIGRFRVNIASKCGMVVQVLKELNGSFISAKSNKEHVESCSLGVSLVDFVGEERFDLGKIVWGAIRKDDDQGVASIFSLAALRNACPRRVGPLGR